MANQKYGPHTAEVEPLIERASCLSDNEIQRLSQYPTVLSTGALAADLLKKAPADCGGIFDAGLDGATATWKGVLRFINARPLLSNDAAHMCDVVPGTAFAVVAQHLIDPKRYGTPLGLRLAITDREQRRRTRSL